jgi:hypothetical protein
MQGTIFLACCDQPSLAAMIIKITVVVKPEGFGR